MARGRLLIKLLMVQMVGVMGGTDLIGNQKSEKFDRQNFSLHSNPFGFSCWRPRPRRNRVQEETVQKCQTMSKTVLVRWSTTVGYVCSRKTWNSYGVSSWSKQSAARSIPPRRLAKSDNLYLGRFIQRSYMLLRVLRTDGQVEEIIIGEPAKRRSFPVRVSILHISRTIRCNTKVGDLRRTMRKAQLKQKIRRCI